MNQSKNYDPRLFNLVNQAIFSYKKLVYARVAKLRDNAPSFCKTTQ